MTAMGNSGLVVISNPALIPGWDLLPVHWKQDTADLNNGTSFDIPGPAAGYLRMLEAIFITSDTVAAGLTAITITIQPIGMQTVPVQASTTSIVLTAPPALINGESLRVTNAGANPGVLSWIYWDELIGNKAVFRETVSGAAYKTIIPAPITGTRRLWIPKSWNGTASVAPRPMSGGFNADTIAHTLQFFLGAGTTLLARSPSVGTLTQIVPTGSLFSSIPGLDLTVRLSEAVAITPINLFGTYESYP